VRKLILNEVTPDKVIENESYLIMLYSGEFISVVAIGYDMGVRSWACEEGGNIAGLSALYVFEAPKKDKIFAD
jgi:hypothetical protein